MQIYGATQLHGPQAINAPHTSRATSAAGVSSSPVSDQLDISSDGMAAGQLIDKINQMPDIRQDKVSQLRAAIASGTYETDDKLSAALNGLLDEIG